MIRKVKSKEALLELFAASKYCRIPGSEGFTYRDTTFLSAMYSFCGLQLEFVKADRSNNYDFRLVGTNFHFREEWLEPLSMEPESVTIPQLREAKSIMESEITAAISDSIQRFKTATGMTPSSIYVNLTSLQEMGRPVEYLVQSVAVGVEL